MRVTVVDRKAMADLWGQPGLYTIITRTIEIPDTCPVCGEPRGKAYNQSWTEDGHTVSISRWENPCGHVDKYADLLETHRANDAPGIAWAEADARRQDRGESLGEPW